MNHKYFNLQLKVEWSGKLTFKISVAVQVSTKQPCKKVKHNDNNNTNGMYPLNQLIGIVNKHSTMLFILDNYFRSHSF